MTLAEPGPRIILETRIGSGRRSTVWRGRRRDDNMALICKIMASDLLKPGDMAAFDREYDCLKRIDHPGVIKAIDLTLIDGAPALLQGDIAGRSLDLLLDKKPLEIGAFLDLAISVADALAAVHGAGLVHCDICPANIVWNPESGAVNLIDFGLAAETLAGEQAPVLPGGNEGTLAYMAPEQTGRMNRLVDHRSDFYALGCSFYEMLTGRPPFETEDPLELVHCHLARQPEAINRLNIEVPEGLAAIVGWLMAKEPADRYQSAFGLKGDLERCRGEWRQSGTIGVFVPMSQDRRPVLRQARKLYGHERERQGLSEAFAQAAAGKRTYVFLSGDEGIGKTALVKDLVKEVRAAGGLVAAARFERLQPEPALHAVKTALAALIDEILAGDETGRARLAADLAGFEKGDARRLLALFPALDELLGWPEPERSQSPDEFKPLSILERLIGILATPGRPLVLFLDDLHFADAASLYLLVTLAKGSGACPLLVIGAYREDWVAADHPLRNALTRLADAAFVQHLNLRGLDGRAIAALLADSLGADPADIVPLAEALESKVLGNPKRIGQYIDRLERLKLIDYEPAEGRWRWNLSAINDLSIGDDLASLAVARLKSLPSDSLVLLQIGATIGDVFPLAVLAAVDGRPAYTVAQSLSPALAAGMIQPVGGGYRLSEIPEDGEKIVYRFVLGQVEDAARTNMSTDERTRLHLAIGRVLKSRMEGGEDCLDEMVGQFNRAVPLLDRAERLWLAENNLAAGLRMQESSAFGTALEHFEQGLTLLGPDGWTERYELALALTVEAARMNGWAGHDEQVVALAETILAKGTSDLDKVKGLEALMQLQAARQKRRDALATGLQALSLLGVKLTLPIGKGRLFGELALTRLSLFGRDIEALIRRPAMIDPRRLAIARFMQHSLPHAFGNDPELFAVLVCRLVRSCLAEGLGPWTAISFACYGLILTAKGQYRLARRFGRLAERLGPQPGTGIVVQAFIEPWHRSLAETSPRLLEAYRQGLARGDLLDSSYCLLHQTCQRLIQGAPLPALLQDVDIHLQQARRVNQRDEVGSLHLYRQLIGNLAGDSETPWNLEGPLFDSRRHLDAMEAAGNQFGLEQAHAWLAYINLLFNRLPEAKKHAGLRQDRRAAVRGTVGDMRSEIIAAIIDLISWDSQDSASRRQTLRQIGRLRRRLKGVEGLEGRNLTHLASLLEAERHRARGRMKQALKHYGRAVALARSAGMLHDLAFALERLAGLKDAIGEEREALLLLDEARHVYLRWGATGKARQLAERLRRPGMAVSGAPLPVALSRRPTGAMAGELDINTVIRAMQALAQPVRLSELLQVMMRLVLANAGGTRGSLLLDNDGRWLVEATASADEDGVDVFCALPYDSDPPLVPLAVIRRVLADGLPLVIDDVEEDHSLAADGYVMAMRPRSMLCLPLRNRSRLVGLLYLENGMAARAFNPERIELLKLISAQMAISIENARLYDGLERMNRTLESQVAERTRALSERTDALHESLNRLQEAKDQLVIQEKMASLGQLTAGIAHEIQNPLNFVNNFARLSQSLLDEVVSLPESDEGRFSELMMTVSENLESIAQQGQRAADIVRRMLEHSRGGSGRFETVELSDLVRLSLASATGSSPETERAEGVAIEVAIDPGLGPMRLVPQDIVGVLVNLLRNAFYAIEERRRREGPAYRPSLSIAAARQDGKVEIRVRDNGEGIAPDILHKVMMPFFTTKPAGEGTGLGMSLSYDIIVKRHRGSMTVRSEQGRYTEVVIGLPSGGEDLKAMPKKRTA